MAAKSLDLAELGRNYKIEPRIMMNAVNCDIIGIHDDFMKIRSELKDIQDEIFADLKKVQRHAHSIRTRLKDPEHLAEKVIRNFNDNPRKYSEINAKNYHKIVTDLIGFRIIILSQNDWENVHNAILDIFPLDINSCINKNEDCISYL